MDRNSYKINSNDQWKEYADELDCLVSHLAANNQNVTSQRKSILLAFLSTEQHLSAEELLGLIRSKHRDAGNIGLSTIYRTMKLLCECGLAEEHTFGDGQSRYEHCFKHTHHDHMICRSCGNIIEFTDSRIEKLQNEVAETYGFHVSSHKMELFGTCKVCAE